MDQRILMRLPLPFGNICEVYPPSLNEVLGNKGYRLYTNLLTLSQEDIWDSLAENEGEIPKSAPAPFDQLMEGARTSLN